VSFRYVGVKFHLIIAIFLALSVPVQAARAVDPAEIQNHQIVQDNAFLTTRDLQRYGNDLGPEFRKKISSLRKNDVWIDLGAGEANALKQYLTAELVVGFELPPLHERARVIALAYHPSGPGRFDAELKRIYGAEVNQVYREVVGDFQKIAIAEISNASVSTSVLGVSSYLKDFTQTTEKALSTLRTGGELWIQTYPENFQLVDADGFDIYDQFGRSHSDVFERQFDSMKGAHLKMVDLKMENPPVIVFERTEGVIKVPQFHVHEFVAGKPPTRKMSLRKPGCLHFLSTLFR
jgi:hypothetical protein